MKFLVSGHTGFKGAWLTLWLAEQGHSVSGISLDPEPGSLFDRIDAGTLLAHDFRRDIRDPEGLISAVREVAPDVVIHLAAQPLVRDSYRDPRTTIETNVMGTLNVLEAVDQVGDVRAQLIITTDKVYRNVNQMEGYKEADPLGGHDPYSASKAMADILTQSWVTSFAQTPTAIGRAGNVIGGGDASPERLMPDLMSACIDAKPPQLRYPQAVRPWQHVLDCLNGYQALIAHVLKGGSTVRDFGAWNFGPGPENFVTVEQIANMVLTAWGSNASWITEPSPEFHEAGLLALDAGKAGAVLNWRDRLSLEDAITWTVDWHKQVHHGNYARKVTLSQIAAFEALA